MSVVITLVNPIGGSNVATFYPSTGVTFTEKVPLTREITVTLPDRSDAAKEKA